MHVNQPMTIGVCYGLGGVSCATSGYEDIKYLLTSSIILKKMIELFKDCQRNELSPINNGNDGRSHTDKFSNNDLSDKLFQAAFSNRLVVLIFTNWC